MAASSFATYLDVTGSRSEASGATPSVSASDAELTAQSGKVLAAVNEGNTRVSEIVSATDSKLSETLIALGMLDQAGLVRLSSAGDSELRAELTPSAANALA